MYVAVKGGETGHRQRPSRCSPTRGGATLPCRRSAPDQIDEQLALAVDRVMAEGSLYDRELAALAIKQARGDLIEAIFLVARLPHHPAALRRIAAARHGRHAVARRISATYKDLPGGQVLGPTFDYTHRLIDFALAGRRRRPPEPAASGAGERMRAPHVTDFSTARA